MGITKGVLFLSLLCVALGDNGIIPGTRVSSSPNVPITSETPRNSTTLPPITITVTPTTSTTTTQKPTTSTTTTQKPTTSTTTTQKPTTSTTTTQKPTTSTTTTQKPTPTPVNPVGKWTVNYTNTDKICLVLEAALEIDLHYKVNNSSKTFPIKITSAATSQGACGKTIENITLVFGPANTINFSFKKSNDSKKYDLQSVIVMLNVTVPGLNGTQIYALAHAKDEFSTPVSNSYKCAKEQSLNLTSVPAGKDFGGELRISQLQVQAFKNSTSTKFDEALDCQSSETPDVVPIAVGCALAALVIIVLIAYLIGRRRSQARGYLSM
ncbi:lysosome-associated membrane glycoprotein 1-like [Tribolium madens]|uniref:lysosome-associated membrane glycoprotein 1-like n=1 Tax=Tribolium madens TaxID=41895 RepID=UPI001CF72F99|nr:lysosome-associated membrane glycoprotein 1-like [Tribolium madens]